ncbi:DUF1286 domain-containing protein [Acidiplasma aeolicum]|jgi:hypothetical protein|uniref:DUF1286 domain-containing protein n=1 Tax=Acidiplasma aeolicum TaxID=507754 RepID=UPI003711394A
MKLMVHYIFSTGILSLINSYFTGFFRGFSIAVIMSFLGNTVIDHFGHKRKITKYGLIPVRSPSTHSFENSIIIGLSISFFIILIMYIFNNLVPITITVISGILVGPSHLFLDAFTQGGIYIKSKKHWRRFAIAHLRYNNKIINATTAFFGIFLIIISFSGFGVIFLYIKDVFNYLSLIF